MSFFFGPFWLWPLYSFIFSSSYTFHHNNIFKFVSVIALIEILNVCSKVCGLLVDQSLNKTPFTDSNAASSLICLYKMSQRWVSIYHTIKMSLPKFERKHFFNDDWLIFMFIRSFYRYCCELWQETIKELEIVIKDQRTGAQDKVIKESLWIFKGLKKWV